MRIGKKIFPYPTLNRDKVMSAFKNSVFTFKYEIIQTDKFYSLKDASVEVTNAGIKSLIDDGSVKVSLIVECSSTVYRKAFEISAEPKTINIPMTDLSGKVCFSVYAYATKDITFTDEDFLEDYEGFTFEIEKYDILCIDDGFTTTINYDTSKDNKVSSIFRIIGTEDIKNGAVQYKNNGKLIFIYMPKEPYGYYYSLSKNEYYQNFFMSLLAVPALAYYLNYFKNEGLEIDEILSENFWFDSVMARYQTIYNEELTDKKFSDLDCNEFAQLALNGATTGAITDLFNMSMKKSIEGGSEDE